MTATRSPGEEGKITDSLDQGVYANTCIFLKQAVQPNNQIRPPDDRSMG